MAVLEMGCHRFCVSGGATFIEDPVVRMVVFSNAGDLHSARGHGGFFDVPHPREYLQRG